jgi:dTDP-4-dehydrorhamnose reductase
MKHILVTGANGQLGHCIRERAGDNPDLRFTFIDIETIDLTNEAEVPKYLAQQRPDYIINCAAYTSVDQAESNQETAFVVNAGIPRVLGAYCSENNAKLLHLSTDYVYDGLQPFPHLEDEPLVPVSVYGRSKLLGEQHLWENHNALVVRTSWLYSEFGNNFLKTMHRLGAERNEIGVVYDQIGSPTYAGDLAVVLLKIIHHAEVSGFSRGIYNYSNEGVCSWYDFAYEIMKAYKPGCKVHPLRTSAYPLPAARPQYSVMDKSKIKSTFGIEIPHWRDSLTLALQHMESIKRFDHPSKT